MASCVSSHDLLIVPESMRINPIAMQEEEELRSEDKTQDTNWDLFSNKEGGQDMANMALDDDPLNVDWILLKLRHQVVTPGAHIHGLPP
jgi:hypothetical protein